VPQKEKSNLYNTFTRRAIYRHNLKNQFLLHKKECCVLNWHDHYRVLNAVKPKAIQQLRTDTRYDANAQLLFYFTQ